MLIDDVINVLMLFFVLLNFVMYGLIVFGCFGYLVWLLWFVCLLVLVVIIVGLFGYYIGDCCVIVLFEVVGYV